MIMKEIIGKLDLRLKTTPWKTMWRSEKTSLRLGENIYKRLSAIGLLCKELFKLNNDNPIGNEQRPKHLTQKDIQMAEKHMEKCLTS